MKDGKKSVIEEALAEFALIETNLNKNAKEILRSVAKDEINSTLNESLSEDEDEYDIEDIEDVDSDVDALPVNDTPDAAPDFGGEESGSEELEIDDIGVDTEEEDLGLDTEEGSEDYGMDMTGASDEDVISVYKKLSGDDEIEVVSSDEVIIKDPVSGAEYSVKTNGGGSAIDQGEMDIDGGLEAEIEPEAEIDSEFDDVEPEAEIDSEFGDTEVDSEVGADDELGFEDADDSEDDDDDDELGESVVYEIEISEDEDDISEDIVRGKGHDKELVNTKGTTGDIEGQKAPEDKDSGDNLEGGFDEEGQNGTGDNHAQHIMEKEDDDDCDDEEINEEEEPIEEHIPKGKGEAHRKPAKADIGQPVAPGAKGERGVKGENVGAKKLAETVKKYNTLLSEAKELQKENVMFRESLKGFRKTITETAVFNTNLSHVTKLFLEHSTTSAEKKEILSRFDEEVSNINESKKLYKRINSELGSKAPITESIENKITSGNKSSGQSTQLNETTTYTDPAQKRVLDLIRRTQ